MGTTMQSKVVRKGNFWFYEFVVSESQPDLAYEIAQNPPGFFFDRYRLGTESILQPARTHLAVPINITSGYRNAKLNYLVGGSKDSDHQYACAADAVAEGLTSYQFVARLLELGVPYRQLVAYKDKPHAHISWNVPGRPYKHQVVFK